MSPGRRAERWWTAHSRRAGKTTRADLTLPDDDSADTIQVTVTDVDGVPAAGATVMVLVEMDGHDVGMLKTADDDGMMKLAPWSLVPVQQIRFTAILDGRCGEAVLNNPDLRAAIQLGPSAAIHGVVRGATADAVLSISILPAADSIDGLPLHTPPSTVVGDSFTMDALPAVPLIVSATTQDGRSGQAHVSLQPGLTAEVEIELHGSAAVTGQIVDVKGHPLAGLIRVDSGNAMSTGADGAFRAEGIAAGQHSLSAWLGPRSVVREFVAAESATLDLGPVVLPDP